MQDCCPSAWRRLRRNALQRVAKLSYQTLVFGVVDGDKSEVVAFGKLDGKAPDGDTVYEIGSVTKTFTAALLARAVLSGRVTLDTAVVTTSARVQNPVTWRQG